MATNFPYFLLLLGLLNSCTRGILYTDEVRPLTINMMDTKNVEEKVSGKNFLITEPFTAPGLRVEWASRGIGDVGKKANFETVHYADLHTFSILLGIFRIRKIQLHGIRPAQENQNSIQ